MDPDDFDEWKRVLATMFDEGRNVVDAKAIDIGIGMLWPDQSYVSLKAFWGSSTRITWGPYHVARMEMLAGDYIFEIYFSIIYFLFFAVSKGKQLFSFIYDI